MHKRTFLSEAETRYDGQRQSNGLGKESATSEVTMYYKACRYKSSKTVPAPGASRHDPHTRKDGFNFWDTPSGGVM